MGPVEVFSLLHTGWEIGQHEGHLHQLAFELIQSLTLTDTGREQDTTPKSGLLSQEPLAKWNSDFRQSGQPFLEGRGR